MSQKHHNLWWIIWSVWSPVACMDQVGAVSVSRVTQFVKEKQFGLVMTCARRACLLYSQRWCEKDETESGWQEWEERQQRHIDINAFIYTINWNDRIYINHIPVRLLANRLAGELIHVKHVVITHVEHEFAPSGPALCALLVFCHHLNNTAT